MKSWEESAQRRRILEGLWEDMERIRQEFAAADDPDILEACTYELKAKQARAKAVLRQERRSCEEQEESAGERPACTALPESGEARRSAKGRRIRISGTDR